MRDWRKLEDLAEQLGSFVFNIFCIFKVAILNSFSSSSDICVFCGSAMGLLLIFVLLLLMFF